MCLGTFSHRHQSTSFTPFDGTLVCFYTYILEQLPQRLLPYGPTSYKQPAIWHSSVSTSLNLLAQWHVLARTQVFQNESLMFCLIICSNILSTDFKNWISKKQLRKHSVYRMMPRCLFWHFVEKDVATKATTDNRFSFTGVLLSNQTFNQVTQNALKIIGHRWSILRLTRHLEIFGPCFVACFHLFIPPEIWEKSQDGPKWLKHVESFIWRKQPWVLDSLSRKELNKLRKTQDSSNDSKTMDPMRPVMYPFKLVYLLIFYETWTKWNVKTSINKQRKHTSVYIYIHVTSHIHCLFIKHLQNIMLLQGWGGRCAT